ncbi:2og-Fe oxygenase family protein [Fistulina hepatica ATCC 64428]|uniref:2og-Fe oxygenase family protein n=1 Tax=Fistulina hepatica ATCC 64428 TaxID=1128425 RepID=A0A0D7A9I0_9AGAR|nr:2og-Fe oxygenase family protein [Fistulina hepatica ATCC 64428]
MSTATTTEAFSEEFVAFHAGSKPSYRKVLKGAELKPTFNEIPVIDFTDIDSSSLATRKALGKLLYQTCSEVGFFYAKGHGIPQSVLDETLSALKKFFELDHDTKMTAHLHKNPAIRGYEPMGETKLDPKSNGDTKEAFTMGDDLLELEQNYPSNLPIPANAIPQNIWPAGAPWFRKALYRYYHHVFPFAMQLVRLIALVLCDDDHAFDDMFKFPITGMRALHYPPRPVEMKNYIGLGAHADFTWITLVLQDSVPALQVLNANGVWIPAPVIPGAFVCNVGQYLERHTNGIFPATVHRVANLTGDSRYSLAFFLTPDPDAVVEPLKECVGESERKYDAINVGDLYIRRILAARQKHPTAKKYKDTPEQELKYDILFKSIA